MTTGSFEKDEIELFTRLTEAVEAILNPDQSAPEYRFFMAVARRLRPGEDGEEEKLGMIGDATRELTIKMVARCGLELLAQSGKFPAPNLGEWENER